MATIIFENCDREQLLFIAVNELSNEELTELLLTEEYNYEDIILNIDSQDRYMKESDLKEIVREKLGRMPSSELSQYVSTFTSDELLIKTLSALSQERKDNISENSYSKDI